MKSILQRVWARWAYATFILRSWGGGGVEGAGGGGVGRRESRMLGVRKRGVGFRDRASAEVMVETGWRKGRVTSEAGGRRRERFGGLEVGVCGFGWVCGEGRVSETARGVGSLVKERCGSGLLFSWGGRVPRSGLSEAVRTIVVTTIGDGSLQCNGMAPATTLSMLR